MKRPLPFPPTSRLAVAIASLALTSLVGLGAPAPAFAKDIRIAHISDQTGPLEAYAKQTQIGLMLGLEYATGGTRMIGAR